MQEIDMKEADKKEQLMKSILDKVDEVGNVEDQLIKLYCLFNCCLANYTKDGEDFLSRRYIKEKLGRVMGGIPIILDASARVMYATLMLSIPKKANEEPNET